MNNQQGPAQNSFTGLTGEQVLKIVFEELSKSGFQLNNFNAIMPSVLNRVLTENGALVGKYFSEMLFQGLMNNFSKK